MSGHVAAQRDTPLAAIVRARIAESGAMTLRAYMTACLEHPEHGYYRTRRAIGRDGDFVTAPEISQVFGELIGLWAAAVWQQMGTPSHFNLVELGPGRGTLMADALRASRIVPGFHSAMRLGLIEPNPVLAALQRETLGSAGIPVHWHDNPSGIAPGPTILIANEVIDCLPIAQYVRSAKGWAEMGIGVDSGGALTFVTVGPATHLPDGEALPDAEPGDILEWRDTDALVRAIGGLSGSGSFTGLFIDYGHAVSGFGDTLQAVRGHRYEHPLAAPGEADLTAQVDFERLARSAAAAGLVAEGPVPQATFLGGLGAVQRASRLMAANPDRASAIEFAVSRLMAPNGMGTRFMAMVLRSAGLDGLPGFSAMDNRHRGQ